MKTSATTVTQYLASLPEDRRTALRAVRTVIKKHLPKGYVERINWGMIAYEVPLKVYPDTYNGQPLGYVGLGSQKNYMVLHMMCVYGSPKLQKQLAAGFKAAGKRLDMGMACVRFRKVDDLALDAIADVVAAVPVQDYVAFVKLAHAKRAKQK
jgi:hypothetical protein